MQMGLLGTAHGAEGGGGDLSGRGSVEGREAQPWPPPGPSAGSVPTVQPKPSSGLHWGQEPRPPRPQALGPWEEMAASPGPVSSQHCQDVAKCHVTIEMPPGRPRKRFCLPEATQMAGPPASGSCRHPNARPFGRAGSRVKLVRCDHVVLGSHQLWGRPLLLPTL